MSQVEQFTIVVADTGDVKAIKRLKLQDDTTNPSVIYKAATMEHNRLVDDAVTIMMASGFRLYDGPIWERLDTFGRRKKPSLDEESIR